MQLNLTVKLLHYCEYAKVEQTSICVGYAFYEDSKKYYKASLFIRYIYLWVKVRVVAWLNYLLSFTAFRGFCSYFISCSRISLCF